MDLSHPRLNSFQTKLRAELEFGEFESKRAVDPATGSETVQAYESGGLAREIVEPTARA